jgi:hypothetical protein
MGKPKAKTVKRQEQDIEPAAKKAIRITQEDERNMWNRPPGRKAGWGKPPTYQEG